MNRPQYSGTTAIRFTWRQYLVLALLFVASFPVRLININSPFLDRHIFRQTQTALTVWEFRAHRMDLLHPKTPLLGRPWEVPMEYPIFQLTAALLDRLAPWDNLDLSIRATNLLYFYLTAAILIPLAQILFRSPVTTLCILAFFLFAPFNIVWSRTSMIEYAACFFTLAYLLLILRWFGEHSFTAVLFSACAGCLAVLTKLTTVPAIVPIAGTYVAICYISGIRRTAPHRTNANQRSSLWLPFSCFTMFAVPLAVGYLFVGYSDAIKAASPYTQWLTSDNLATWNFGTLAQRIHLGSYMVILERIVDTMVPLPFVIFLVIGGLALCKKIRITQGVLANRVIGLSVLVSALFPVLLFFNLYVVHDYYLIAISPFIAIYAGVGLSHAFSLYDGKIRWAIILLALSCCNVSHIRDYFRPSLETSYGDPRLQFLSAVQDYVKPDEPIIVVNDDWSSMVPYYTRRRAFMAKENVAPQALRSGFLKQGGYHWIIRRNGPRTELDAELEQQWEYMYRYLIMDMEDRYTLTRLSATALRIEKAFDVRGDVHEVVNAALERDLDGTIRVTSRAEDFYVFWRINDAVQYSSYDAIYLELRPARSKKGYIYLSHREDPYEAIRMMPMSLRPGVTNRVIIPMEHVIKEGDVTYIRVNPGVLRGETIIITKLGFVKFAHDDALAASGAADD